MHIEIKSEEIRDVNGCPFMTRSIYQWEITDARRVDP